METRTDVDREFGQITLKLPISIAILRFGYFDYLSFFFFSFLLRCESEIDR